MRFILLPRSLNFTTDIAETIEDKHKTFCMFQGKILQYDLLVISSMWKKSIENSPNFKMSLWSNS